MHLVKLKSHQCLFQVIVISWPHRAKTLATKSRAKITMLIFMIVHGLLFIPGFYSRKLVTTSKGKACAAREGKIPLPVSR